MSASELAARLRAQYPSWDDLRPCLSSVLAQPHRGVLIVLQAVNAGGKDGLIEALREMLPGIDGMRVERLQRARPDEKPRDLFESALAVGPEPGEVVFFNRSYYEELIRAALTRTPDNHALKERALDLEATLRGKGVVQLKLFLHIDKDEQHLRLLRRQEVASLKHLHNAWDLRDQQIWDDIMRAHDVVLADTHSVAHPWFTIPGNDRQERNIAGEALIALVATAARGSTGSPARR